MDVKFSRDLNELIRKRINEIHTAVAAEVISYNPSKRTLSVKPYAKRANEGFTFDFPIINNVPVLFPGGGGCEVFFPINKGDIVLLVFSEEALDVWRKTGTLNEQLRYALTNAIAIPCLPKNEDNSAAVLAQTRQEIILKTPNVTESLLSAFPCVLDVGSVISLPSTTESTQPTLNGNSYAYTQNNKLYFSIRVDNFKITTAKYVRFTAFSINKYTAKHIESIYGSITYDSGIYPIAGFVSSGRNIRIATADDTLNGKTVQVYIKGDFEI